MTIYNQFVLFLNGIEERYFDKISFNHPIRMIPGFSIPCKSIENAKILDTIFNIARKQLLLQNDIKKIYFTDVTDKFYLFSHDRDDLGKKVDQEFIFKIKNAAQAVMTSLTLDWKVPDSQERIEILRVSGPTKHIKNIEEILIYVKSFVDDSKADIDVILDRITCQSLLMKLALKNGFSSQVKNKLINKLEFTDYRWNSHGILSDKKIYLVGHKIYILALLKKIHQEMIPQQVKPLLEICAEYISKNKKFYQDSFNEIPTELVEIIENTPDLSINKQNLTESLRP